MVVLLVNKFFYEKGGSERYFFMQSDELAARGHDVVHFSMEHADNRPSKWSRYFVSHRDYDDAADGNKVRSALEFVRSGEAATKLSRLIAVARPDVAHLHNIYHQLTPSIIPVLKRAGIPVVITLHDYKLVCPNYRLFAHGRYCELCLGGHYHHAVRTRCNDASLARSALLAVEAYWQRLTGVYDQIDVLLAPSMYMRDMMVRGGFPAERVHYLPSFLPVVEDGGSGGGVRETLPERYILYFGRLSEEKGLVTLLRALRERPGIPLVLAGDGPLRPGLEESVSEWGMNDVHFTGYLGKGDLDGVVGAAEAVVLPAEWPENAPFTVLEAALQGVPVIVSDMGGLPEMAEIVGGVVFANGDPDALRASIEDVWNAPEEARERASLGRTAVLERYDRERHMRALESIYRDAMEGRS